MPLKTMTPPTRASRPFPPKVDAPESEHARYKADSMDRYNERRFHAGLPPRYLRASYPGGYGPGQMLAGPIRAQLAAYVDAADPAEVEAANAAARAAFTEAFIEKYGPEMSADDIARLRHLAA